MKHLLFFFLGVSFLSTAQTTSKWSLGIHAGLNSSWIAPNTTPKASPVAGFQSIFRINERVFLQAEVNYSLVKSSQTYRRQLATDAYTEFYGLFTFNYIEVPVLVNYAFVDRKKVKFSVGVGSAFRYATSSKVDARLEVVRSPTISDSYAGPPIDMSNETNYILICPTIQSSVEFKLQNHDLFKLSLRYSVSANDPLPDPASTPSELAFNYGVTFSGSSRLQTLSLLVAYQFGLK